MFCDAVSVFSMCCDAVSEFNLCCLTVAHMCFEAVAISQYVLYGFNCTSTVAVS